MSNPPYSRIVFKIHPSMTINPAEYVVTKYSVTFNAGEYDETAKEVCRCEDYANALLKAAEECAATGFPMYIRGAI